MPTTSFRFAGRKILLILLLALCHSFETQADTSWGWQQYEKNPNSIGVSGSCSAALDGYISAFNALGPNWCLPGCTDPCAADSSFSIAIVGAINDSTGACMGTAFCTARQIRVTKIVCPDTQEGLWNSFGSQMVCGAACAVNQRRDASGVCQELQPVICAPGQLWGGTTCIPAASCTAALSGGGYVDVCSAMVAAAKNQGPQQCIDQRGNPCKPGNGQKYQRELVLRTPTFNLELTYNSVPVSQLPSRPYYFGRGWSSTYGSAVWLIMSNKAAALRPDGKFYQFTPPGSGNVYVS